MRPDTFANAESYTAAAALNRVFEGYYIPVGFTAEHLDLHVLYNDVDRSLSPLWYDDDGNVVAAAVVGVRDSRAWIGGFGVAPPYRGQGYAKRLLEHIIEAARGRGARSIALEVLQQNTPAAALYRAAGFETVRELWSYQAQLGDESMPPGYAAAAPEPFVEQCEELRPCWQRETATLRNGAVSGAVHDSRGNFAAYRSSANVAQVLKLRVSGSAELSDLARAIAADRGVQTLLLLNEPAGSDVAQYAETAGWSRPFLQFEMMKPL